ncbi:MAG TPA: DUF255 domain-containing protein [Polyangiales bacterium]|jgi:hypothetical protein|nr:DUF255 domain-containing protein [Polyangiales bacterium]
MRLRTLALILLGFSLWACAGTTPRAMRDAHSASGPAAHAIAWQPWARATFERARHEHKYLLVSVETEWCHWCHVMNDVTFRDPRVLQILDAKFIAVRVDADARPDVAEAYQRWGWPATGLLSPEAEPILNLRGCRAPEELAQILATVAAGGGRDASAAIAQRAAGAATADWSAIATFARAQLDREWDAKQSGWGTPQKYPYAAPVEHALFLAATANDAARKQQALAALGQYARLIDPVWGGMYQYSVYADWAHPHYEKVHTVQAGALATFVQAFRATGDRQWLTRARQIESYLVQHLLAADGAFYANQDADVGREGEPGHMLGEDFYALPADARARVTQPGIDTHEFASYNGMSIAALCALYEATLDANVLAEAVRAYDAIERDHRRGDGYTHAAHDSDPLEYFTDDAEMARALLALHEATGDARYLDRLHALVRHVLATFEDREHGGFFTHTPDAQAVGALARVPMSMSDNARFARVLLALSRSEGDDELRTHAERALRALGSEDTLRAEGRQVGEYLLAVEDLLASYALISVVGPEGDPRTQALLRAALSTYAPNRRVVRVDPERSHYPYPDQPAAYLCTSDSCSLPIEDPSAIAKQLVVALSASNDESAGAD